MINASALRMEVECVVLATIYNDHSRSTIHVVVIVYYTCASENKLTDKTATRRHEDRLNKMYLM
jgi:ADP-ribose pyrophosphatase YjhB (NUDIX family)